MGEQRGCLIGFLEWLWSLGSEGDEGTYRLRADLLSPAERSFYHTLLSVVDGRYHVLAKVRLADVVYPAPHNQRAYMVLHNRISQKHLDFPVRSPNLPAGVGAGARRRLTCRETG